MSKFQSKEHREKINKTRKRNGWFKNAKKTKEKMSEKHKGEKHPLFGKHHSDKSKEKMRIKMAGRTPWNKGKPNFDGRGEKCHLWRGGITLENEKIRHSIESRLWREAVFARDNYTCQKYNTRGGELVAHHINNFAEKEELRFAIDNGITLSEKAHKEFHKKYGFKNNTREQLLEFLNNK